MYKQKNYAELHVISNYTFLRGASHPHELVEQAVKLRYHAIALTDECSLSGIVKAYVASKIHKIKLITGSEFSVENTSFPDHPLRLIVLASNKTAYHELSSLITLGRRRSEKGNYQVLLTDLDTIENGLIIWLPQHDLNTNFQQGKLLYPRFKNRLWIGVSFLSQDNQQQRYHDLLTLANRLDVPMVACNNVHMHRPERKPLLDILYAIKHNQSVQSLASSLAKNGEQYLRSFRTLQAMYPAALLNETITIANRCQFNLTDITYEYPPELLPEGVSAINYLRHLCNTGGKLRWPDGIQPSNQRLLEKELKIIEAMHYEYYFLTIHDIVMYAKSKNIYYQGRGSAANSIVCYCLFITAIGPDKIDMLFERFISKERNEPPDIDVDFEHHRREEVIQYIYTKYGRERAAIVASLVTYKPKSAIRDVGKALGIHEAILDNLSKSLSWWDRKEALQKKFEEEQFKHYSRLADYFMENVQTILSFPRHLSQHVGGFIITKSPISTIVPVENTAMENRTVIQWDKDDIETMGLLKIDVLALGMLTAIHKAIDSINSHTQLSLSLDNIPDKDGSTYDMLCAADTVGVFQVESRAQMSMLPRLKPRNFYDLVIEVAIVRPGPIQGDMVHPFLRRRDGKEKVSYPNEKIKDVLKKTLGVPIFQEQVIKIAMVAANFSGGEADQLRRAMAGWGRTGHLDVFEKKLMDGMLSNGYSPDFAKRLFEQIKGFSGYGFPESHSASFALLVYVSAWIKCHYPTDFYASLLNSQPMGFYTPSQLLQDAQHHGIDVLPISLRSSQWESSVVQSKQSAVPQLRLGFHLVRGFNEAAAKRILDSRQNTSFTSVLDLKQRARLSNKELQVLIHSNALIDSFGERKQVHWQAQAIHCYSALLSEHESDTVLEVPDFIHPESRAEKMIADYDSTQLCLDTHPLSLLRQHAPYKRCKTSSQLASLRHGQFVRIAGLVTCRQRPASASGVIFLTLEDETGNSNIVVWSSLFSRYRQALMTGKLLVIKGTIERQKSVIHVVAGHIDDHSDELCCNFNSRDFH